MSRPLGLVLCSILLKQVVAPPRVCIPNLGCVIGSEMAGFQGGKFEAFMGIPYAKKPINELRFANPQPMNFSGELRATAPMPDCIQKNYLLPTPVIYGDEDCLYLNIYRPKVRRITPMAVMVFIHGGGFFSGTANYSVVGPEYFMDNGEVILVTMAYRLGPFGFLASCDDTMPGNLGLKDQNLALKWVNDYISAFDGHPKQITLFGQGSGAASVHLHMLTKKSRDLFQRAILMSGNAALPFINMNPHPLQQARDLGRFAGVRNAQKISKSELTEKLRKLPAEEILVAADKFKEWHVDPLIVFRPVIEFPSEEAFLTADPKFTIASGQYKKIPWMTGIVPNEGSSRSLTIWTNETLREQFNKDFTKRFMAIMELPPSESSIATQELLKKYYFDRLNQINDVTYRSFMDSISERGFVHPFIKTVEQYVDNANLFTAPVYLYKFNYRGIRSYSNILTGERLDYGVVHGDDLLYLFRSKALFPNDVQSTSTDAKVIGEMVEIFVTFAKTAKPKRSEQMQPCNRKAMNRVNKICDYWEIKNEGTSYTVKIGNYFDKMPIQFWDKIVQIFDWCYY